MTLVERDVDILLDRVTRRARECRQVDQPSGIERIVHGEAVSSSAAAVCCRKIAAGSEPLIETLKVGVSHRVVHFSSRSGSSHRLFCGILFRGRGALRKDNRSEVMFLDVRGEDVSASKHAPAFGAALCTLRVMIGGMSAEMICPGESVGVSSRKLSNQQWGGTSPDLPRREKPLPQPGCSQ